MKAQNIKKFYNFTQDINILNCNSILYREKVKIYKRYFERYFNINDISIIVNEMYIGLDNKYIDILTLINQQNKLYNDLIYSCIDYSYKVDLDKLYINRDNILNVLFNKFTEYSAKNLTKKIKEKNFTKFWENLQFCLNEDIYELTKEEEYKLNYVDRFIIKSLKKQPYLYIYILYLLNFDSEEILKNFDKLQKNTLSNFVEYRKELRYIDERNLDDTLCNFLESFY